MIGLWGPLSVIRWFNSNEIFRLIAWTSWIGMRFSRRNFEISSVVVFNKSRMTDESSGGDFRRGSQWRKRIFLSPGDPICPDNFGNSWHLRLLPLYHLCPLYNRLKRQHLHNIFDGSDTWPLKSQWNQSMTKQSRWWPMALLRIRYKYIIFQNEFVKWIEFWMSNSFKMDCKQSDHLCRWDRGGIRAITIRQFWSRKLN